MLLNRRPWDNLETPEKIQMLTTDISEIQKFALLTTNQYKQQMELVLEIINDLTTNLATNDARVTGVEDVSGFDKVVHQPQPRILARAQNVINNYVMHIRAL
jgi:hypothetical protein